MIIRNVAILSLCRILLLLLLLLSSCIYYDYYRAITYDRMTGVPKRSLCRKTWNLQGPHECWPHLSLFECMNACMCGCANVCMREHVRAGPPLSKYAPPAAHRGAWGVTTYIYIYIYMCVYIYIYIYINIYTWCSDRIGVPYVPEGTRWRSTRFRHPKVAAFYRLRPGDAPAAPQIIITIIMSEFISNCFLVIVCILIIIISVV